MPSTNSSFSIWIVIADFDPNKKASGSIDKLRQRGIKVDVGLMKKNARKINRIFYNFHEKKRPYVILKYASTLDGFVAQKDGISKWITNKGYELGIMAKNLIS